MALRQLLPMTALRAIGQSHVSMITTAATFVTAGVGLLLAGWVAPLGVAVVCGLSPLPGYAVITTMVNREFGRPVIREVLAFLRDLACGLLGFALGRGVAKLPGDGAPVLQTAIAASVGFLTALTMLALAQPKMIRRLLRHTGMVRPVPVEPASDASAVERWAHGFALRRRGS